MQAITTTVAVLMYAASWAVHAGTLFERAMGQSWPPASSAADEHDVSVAVWQHEFAFSDDPTLIAESHDSDRIRSPAFIGSYSLPMSGRSSVFGSFGMPGEPALGPPVSYMRRLSGIDNPETGRASHWLDASNNVSHVFTVGYAWHALKFEGSAFSGPERDERSRDEKYALRLNSTSTRLSYNPSPNWSFQFSRGMLSGVDQLAPDEDVRRATLSATYGRALSNGNWQSTIAWGRNARKEREPTMGYLLESTLRFNNLHAVFGRLEQVGSGELVAEDGAAMNRTFKMNKLTFGYFHESGVRGPVGFDAGVLVSRYIVPSSASPVYAGDPASFMVFVRLKLR